jgi:hypothetical protein
LTVEKISNVSKAPLPSKPLPTPGSEAASKEDVNIPHVDYLVHLGGDDEVVIRA